jgi:hypothetical protein
MKYNFVFIVRNTEAFEEQFFIGLQRKRRRNLFVLLSTENQADWEWVTGENIAVLNLIITVFYFDA